MNGIMDCIEVGSLSSLCKISLASSRAVLCIDSHLQVLLRAVRYHFAEKFCKLCSVLSLFVSGLLIVHSDLRVSLAVCNTCHCKIHTNLRALALEVCSQIRKNIFADALCNADYMLGSPYLFALLKLELLGRCLTDRAEHTVHTYFAIIHSPFLIKILIGINNSNCY